MKIKNDDREEMERILVSIEEFLNRPGINKKGFFEEIGIKREAFDIIIRREKRLTSKNYSRILPQLLKYGYREI